MSKITKRKGSTHAFEEQHKIDEKQGDYELARLNATRHGALGNVVAPHEEEAYELHVNALLTDLQPMCYLDYSLVRTIAMSLWKLERYQAYCARQAESRFRAQLRKWAQIEDLQTLVGLMPKNQHGLQVPHLMTLEDIVQELANVYNISLDDLLGCKEDAIVIIHNETEAGMRLLALEQAKDIEHLPERALKQLAIQLIHKSKLETHDSQTNYKLSMAEVCDLWQLDEAYSLELAKQLGHSFLIKGQRGRELVKQFYNDLEVLKLSSFEPNLDKEPRYEAHLQRSISRLINELNAAQAKRQGEHVPLARLMVTGDSELVD